jgi:hypothetical protein
MTKRPLRRLLKLTTLTFAALLALSARADLQEHKTGHQQRGDDGRKDHDADDDDDHEGRKVAMRLPSGQFITPTAIDDAVQQTSPLAPLEISSHESS